MKTANIRTNLIMSVNFFFQGLSQLITDFKRKEVHFAMASVLVSP